MVELGVRAEIIGWSEGLLFLFSISNLDWCKKRAWVKKKALGLNRWLLVLLLFFDTCYFILLSWFAAVRSVGVVMDCSFMLI